MKLLAWAPGYNHQSLTSDALAGLIVAIMLVPQGMAYALLAGLPPQVGLYASIVPLIIYGLLGSSRTLAVGPVAIVSLMVLLCNRSRSVLIHCSRSTVSIRSAWRLPHFGRRYHSIAPLHPRIVLVATCLPLISNQVSIQ